MVGKKSSLCVSQLRKRCVALYCKKLLELWRFSWIGLELDDERPTLRISLPMATSFYLFWPSKLLLLSLLFWIRELGDAKETLLNQEDSCQRAPLFRSSIPCSCFEFRQKNKYINTHVMFTFSAKLSPLSWWFAVCLLSSLWWVVFQTI